MNATDKKFREDLEGYEVKPSDSVWERIEGSLPEREDAKAPVLWYRWAAAAAIVLMFGLGWMSREWTAEPVGDQIAAKPTEELEEARESVSSDSSDISGSSGSSGSNGSSEISQENGTEGELATEEKTTDNTYETDNTDNTVVRDREKTISLPRASVNLAQLSHPAERQPIADKRKKFKIDLQFTEPDHRELIAQADPPKKSVTEYATQQWEALNGLRFKQLEDPRGKVELPKIDKKSVQGTLNKIFNRNED